MTKYLYIEKNEPIPEYPEYPIFRSFSKVFLTWGRNYIGILKSRAILGYLGYFGIWGYLSTEAFSTTRLSPALV